MVSGSRDWTDASKIREAFSFFPGSHTLIHGAARGADTIAAEVAKSLGWTVTAYPADWKKLGKAAGIIRNQTMIDSKPDILLAFPLPSSRGTYDAINKAHKADLGVWVYSGA